MQKRSTIILLISLLLLITPFFFPLWSITLKAPQYPEGLGIYIEISDISGHNPNDLKNINLVNHYIGMKEINPDSIPELSYMPWILGFLILFLATVILTRRVNLLLAFTVVYTVIALAGLVDFYLWNYDYGHNLNTATAAIIIPDVSYQPPIFGTKQMLNFRTTSLPGIGGWSAILSLLLSTAVLVSEKWRKQR